MLAKFSRTQDQSKTVSALTIGEIGFGWTLHMYDLVVQPHIKQIIEGVVAGEALINLRILGRAWRLKLGLL